MNENQGFEVICNPKPQQVLIHLHASIDPIKVEFGEEIERNREELREKRQNHREERKGEDKGKREKRDKREESKI